MNITHRVVIEGGVTSERTRHQIRLSRTGGVTGPVEMETISGATVQITFENETITFNESDSIDGVYVSDTIQLHPGIEYSLEVVVDGEVYQATDYMQYAEPFDPIIAEPIPDGTTLFGSNNKGFYFISLPGNFGGGKAFIYYLEIEVPNNWKDDFPYPLPPRYITNPPAFTTSDTSYLVHPSLEISALFEYGKTEIWGYPLGTNLRERQYMVSANYYDYLRSVLLETDWRGINFLQAVPANVPTNISNNGLGYFYAIDYYEVKSVIEE